MHATLRKRLLLGTTALGLGAAALFAATTVKADELLPTIQGYIDTASNDDLKSRWEAAYATLTGNIEWVPAQEVKVESEYGDYTKVIEGYWAVKGKPGMRAITLASASLYADLHKAGRWNPVKKAIRELLRNDQYGKAPMVSKLFYEQWGHWAKVRDAYKPGIQALDTPAARMTAMGGYQHAGEMPPLANMTGGTATFTASISDAVQVHAYAIQDDKNPTVLNIHYDMASKAPWSADLTVRLKRGRYTRYSQEASWSDLQWTNGAMAAENATGELLTGAFYKMTQMQGTNDEYGWRIAGNVATKDIAATYVTDAVLVPVSK